MDKRFFIAVVVMFAVSMLLGFVVHGTLLAPQYAALGGLFRGPEDQQNYVPWMLLAHVFLAAGFTWVYARGRENRPFFGQGVRFGIAIAVLTTIPGYLIYFAVQPLPANLVAQQIVYDTVAMMIMGVVVAWMYRKAGSVAAR